MRIFSSAIILAVGLGVVSAGVTVDAQANRVTIAQHEAAMKMIAQNAQPMQKAIKSNMLADAGKHAAELERLFTQVEQFWTQHKKDDAMKLAQTAKMGAADVVAAIKANDQAKAMMAAGNLGGTCKQCHGTYREGNPEVGYSIKADAKIMD